MAEITGTSVNDTLIGDARSSDTQISGGLGDDQLSSGFRSLRTELFGGAGDDTLFTSLNSRRVTMEGGAGNDRLVAREGTRDIVMQGGQESDTLIAEDVHGATLVGGSGDDLLLAGSGDDLLIWDAGDDTISGGMGQDTLSIDFGEGFREHAAFDFAISNLDAENNAVTLHVGPQMAVVQDVDVFVFSGETFGFEDLAQFLPSTGTAGNDVLSTAADGRVIDALAGDDWVTLGNGNATVTGGGWLGHAVLC